MSDLICECCMHARVPVGRRRFCSDKCRITSADRARRARVASGVCLRVGCSRQAHRRGICAKHLGYLSAQPVSSRAVKK